MYPHHPILYQDAGILSPERAKLHLLGKKKKKKKAPIFGLVMYVRKFMKTE